MPMNKMMYTALRFLLLGVILSHDGQSVSCTNVNKINESTEAENEEFNCSRYEAESDFAVLQNGSLYVPSTESVHEKYYLNESVAYICVKPVSVPDDTYHRFSDHFVSCGHILIDSNEYELLKNGTVYVEMYAKMYEPSDYLIHGEGVYVCVPEYEEMQKVLSVNESVHQLNKFSESFAYVTYIGISLSIVSLLLHLIVFCFVDSVRNLPGCCLASLSLSLLCAYLCFLGSGFVQTAEECAAIGVCLYYFFMAAFFWMNTIAFDVWRSFRVVTKELRISNRVSWRRFLGYSLYGWLVPAILVVSVKLIDINNLLPTDLKPNFGVPVCWFGQRKPLLLFFATPLCLVMVLNALFFFDVTYVISRAALKTRQSLQEATLRKRACMFLKLGLIMGLTWIVGIIAGSVDNQILWYFFIILNTLQGLFIFVVFSLSSKVKNLFRKSYRKRFQSHTSTSVRTISQTV